MKITLLLPFLLLLGCNSCEKSNFPDRFYDITVINKSDDTIQVYLALATEFVYPDTLIETMKPTKGFRTIEAGASTYFDSRIKWEKIFEKDLPSDTLSIFIFDKDTLNYYGWETVRSEYKVLKRYDLSIENLKQLDFKVTYPPTAEMSGVKMYP